MKEVKKMLNAKLEHHLVGPHTGALICILGLEPYLLMWVRPRRSK